MAKNLRTYLEQLAHACPDELLRVPGNINSDLEATTFLRKLELEGLVTMIPRRGAEVAKISEKNLKDVLEVRIALESLAVELACERIS